MDPVLPHSPLLIQNNNHNRNDFVDEFKIYKR